MSGAMEAADLTVGFVGLGNMGWPMARNLRQAGHPVIVRAETVEDRRIP